jgi:cytochrome c553
MTNLNGAVLLSPRAGRTVVLAVMLMVNAIAASAAPHITDLRRIKPIHGDAMAGAQKAATCLACHGADGVSVAPTFPRLAGQRPDYLYHRLASFKQADPNDPYYSKLRIPPKAASDSA